MPENNGENKHQPPCVDLQLEKQAITDMSARIMRIELKIDEFTQLQNKLTGMLWIIRGVLGISIIPLYDFFKKKLGW